MSKITDKSHLEEQIYQLREVINTLENQSSGVPSIQPDEIWTMLNSKDNTNKPMHPRLQQMLQGHIDVSQVKQGLHRLENDLNDLSLDEHELYDPFEHELNGGKEERWNEPSNSENSHMEESKSDVSEEQVRDKEQRPLSAYGIKSDTNK